MTLTMPMTETGTAPLLTAVTYQRVSTKEQASKGGRDEGFSIPAQRQANARKAEDLGARIVAEFVDAGESARSADRPDLQRMLEYIATHQVTYCIVHKVDRLARNRLDDVEIHRRLVEAGVTLVSATENIDETPSGMLLHGIMSSIAEFYSKNLATEVTKGLTQKFETGGTPMRAPIGYLNVRKRDEQGREYRTVEIDAERAPLVRWVFEQYAAGERTVVDLLADVTARGLTSVPTPKRPSGPVGRSTFFDLLRNPYYIGIVRYKGAEQTGTHEPLVDVETWQQVQRLLDSRKKASERRRTHDHYLKGSLFCGSCGSRMQLDFPANRQGVRYAYYVCSGRASKRKSCTRRAVPVGIAEQLVADCYREIAITEEDYAALAAQVEAAFDERLASRSDELAELTANRQRLQNESDKLLAAHFADAIDLETLKRHQDRIRTGLADIDRRLATEHDQHEGSRKQLSTALSLLVDCATLYARTDDQGKRLANQALTNGIEISEDERATIRLAEPFAALVPEPTSTDVSGSSTSDWVELGGFEPPTFSLRTRRATNCAIAPQARNRLAPRGRGLANRPPSGGLLPCRPTSRQDLVEVQAERLRGGLALVARGRGRGAGPGVGGQHGLDAGRHRGRDDVVVRERGGLAAGRRGLHGVRRRGHGHGVPRATRRDTLGVDGLDDRGRPANGGRLVGRWGGLLGRGALGRAGRGGPFAGRRSRCARVGGRRGVRTGEVLRRDARDHLRAHLRAVDGATRDARARTPGRGRRAEDGAASRAGRGTTLGQPRGVGPLGGEHRTTAEHEHEPEERRRDHARPPRDEPERDDDPHPDGREEQHDRERETTARRGGAPLEELEAGLLGGRLTARRCPARG